MRRLDKYMLDMTVIILTKNEELNIKKCISSVKGMSKRIVVVDSYSKDGTVEIAKRMGADIYEHPFKHYGAQFQYALDNCDIKTKWVFRLDADEEVSKESYDEIVELCTENENTDINGVVFRLSESFMGKRLKHGGDCGVLSKLCIFKYGKAYMEDRYLGEHIILTEGRSVILKSLSYHNDKKDTSFYINKLNWYAAREAKDYFEQINSEDNQKMLVLDKKTRFRRIVKFKIFYHMPKRLRASLVFIYYYYLHLGFLDGKEAYYLIFFRTKYYRTLVDAKIYEVLATGKTIGETGAWS